jgi:hypothetical protein
MTTARRSTLLACLALAGCGGSSAPLTEWTVTPASGNLRTDDRIYVSFTRMMKGSTLQLGGSLGVESDALWSDTHVHADTLTIQGLPGGWTVRPSATLTLSVLDDHDREVNISLTDYGVMSGADGCGFAGRACVNSWDCVHTDADLEAWADECGQQGGGTIQNLCLTHLTTFPTSNCVTCYQSRLDCRKNSCGSGASPAGPCATSVTSSACRTCMGAYCDFDFYGCSGRTTP